MKAKNKITLILAHVFDDYVIFREQIYTQSNTMLVADNTNNGSDAPIGLRKVRESDLPKLGGLLGTVALAHDRESALEALTTLYVERADRLTKDLSDTNKRLAVVAKTRP